MKSLIVYIILILGLTSQLVNAQSEFAQNVQRLLSASSRESGPRVYITFNQPEYHPGDTAFFKAFLLTPEGNAFIKGWQVIDIFIVDNTNTIVLRNRTSIKNGVGASQVAVPTSAKEGRYTFIVAQPDLTKSSKHPIAFKTSFIVTGKKLQQSSGPNAFQSFPEGGKLVDGIPNNILVTGVPSGDTIVLYQSGLRVASTVSQHGIGKLSFTPEHTDSYELGHQTNRIIPGPRAKDGLTMAVNTSKESNSLSVVLHCKNATNLPPLHLVCINKTKLVETHPVFFENNESTSFTLPLTMLPAGVSRLSVLDEKGNAYADRFFYKAEQTVAPMDSVKTYSTRSTITFEIPLPKHMSSRSVAGAVSVYKKDLFPTINQTIGHTVAFGDLHVDGTLGTTLPAELINDLLISATSSLDWKNIWSASSDDQRPMYSSFFKGKIILPNGDAPKDSCLITFWLKNQDFVYHVYAPRDGRFSFPLFTEYGDDEILYTVSHQQTALPDARIILDSVRIPDQEQQTVAYSEKQNPYAWFSSLRSAVEKSYGYFQHSNSDATIRPYVESIPTDAQFPIEKFKAFTNVAEMLNEVIPVAKAKKVGQKYELRVFMREFAMHAAGNPLIMIDGVVTDSIDYLMNMRPEEIKSLGVVNSRNKLVRYGALGRNGIITVETTRQEIHDLFSQKSVFVKGVDVPIEFSSLTMEKPSRTPVLRSALYWDPNVTLTRSESYRGEIRTSDDVGDYVIYFAGIDERGVPVEIVQPFTVKYPSQ